MREDVCMNLSDFFAAGVDFLLRIACDLKLNPQISLSHVVFL